MLGKGGISALVDVKYIEHIELSIHCEVICNCFVCSFSAHLYIALDSKTCK